MIWCKEISDFYRQADQARKPTDLVPVVRDTLKLLQDILPPTVEIREDLNASCGPVLASATGVQQVLMNLCSNSVQAMHRDQGTIEITLRGREIDDWHQAIPQDLDPGTYVRLTVRTTAGAWTARPSTGSSIPTSPALEDGSKMGIGLSTVSRILQDHDGVTIAHSAVGEGTSFDIYFPLIAWRWQPDTSSLRRRGRIGQAVPIVEAPVHRCPPRPSIEESQPTGTEATVLLVDDEEMVAQVMSPRAAAAGLPGDHPHGQPQGPGRFLPDPRNLRRRGHRPDHAPHVGRVA